MNIVRVRYFSFFELELLLFLFYRCEYWGIEILWFGYRGVKLVGFLIFYIEFL